MSRYVYTWVFFSGENACLAAFALRVIAETNMLIVLHDA